MEYLLIDPRPDLPDTKQWRLLFLHIPLLEDKPKACKIHLILWSLRCYGMILKLNSSGFFFSAIIDPKQGFDSADEFRDMRDRFLRPHSEEIASLLRKVAGNE
ncbi:hypothetical protein [Cohnella abietis]|uniref:Uncharacterized protein n=1 Tax=Cohnella abietis TaxID=2507935 RepID=A0A3T1D2X3_9BACL|nr:hypothetical protein [Cohnella abietis]BBI32457.1 hypothetical protein KCTCHS21_18560 [Cohnella abietis]